MYANPPIPVEILIPTYNRPAALAVTLAGLASQQTRAFRVIISDQSPDPVYAAGEVSAMMHMLEAHGTGVAPLRHLPARGMAEQRQFLLERSSARYVLYLDDDVWLEPYVLTNLITAIEEEGCGFVGAALVGLSFLVDVRPQQQAIEFWEGKVHPETVTPESPAWARHHLHSAANLYHVWQALDIPPDQPRRYKVAWVGGCVLYDRAKLIDAGGFGFWKDLPKTHAGEDVLAQLRVMAAYGGCGLIPSGAYHLELPTTLPTRQVDAPKILKVND